MRFQESNMGSRGDFAEYIKKLIPEMFAGRLKVEGKTVSIPQDKDLDYKVKYDLDERGGSVSIKVSWEEKTEEEEDVEVDAD